MAENKKSFVLYADLLRSIEHLTNEEKGILFNHLLEYVNDKNPVLEDRLLLTAWKPIENQLKRDLIKFEETKENRSINGRLGNLKRWNFDLYTKVIENQIDIKEAEAIANSRKLSPPDSTLSQTVANVADNVNVNDSVNVNDNVNVNKKRVVNKFTPPPKIDVVNYFVENGYKQEVAIKAWNYYETGKWKDGSGKQVKNWKQKMQSVWFKDEHKKKETNNLMEMLKETEDGNS